MAFSNQTITAPNPNKPHICMRDGYWRVSPWKIKHSLQLWHLAHQLAGKRNEALRQRRLYARKMGALPSGE